MSTATIPSPPDAPDALDRDRRRDRHADARPTRLAERDEPGADPRAHRRRGLARRPGAAARPDRHRRRRRAFSSGGDVNWFKGGRRRPRASTCPPNVRRGAEVLHQAIVDFRRIPYPVIGAVNGVAAGAGFSLALMCDIRIASTNAAFVCAYGRIGASPDGGMTYFLPRVVGPATGARAAAQRSPALRRAGAGDGDRLRGGRARRAARRGAREGREARREGAALRADGEAADRPEPRQLARRAPAGRAPRDRRLDGAPRTCARASPPSSRAARRSSGRRPGTEYVRPPQKGSCPCESSPP